MGAFSLTKAAKKDLRDIAKHSEERWGRAQRKHYLKGMDDAFHRLTNSPQLGKACDYISPGLWKYSYQSHTIYYDHISDTQIEIIRILYKRMDVSLVEFGT